MSIAHRQPLNVRMQCTTPTVMHSGRRYKASIDMYLYLDSASVVMVEAGGTSHFRMAAMLNGPT